MCDGLPPEPPLNHLLRSEIYPARSYYLVHTSSFVSMRTRTLGQQPPRARIIFLPRPCDYPSSGQAQDLTSLAPAVTMASVTSVFSCLGQIAEVGYRLQHFAADEHRDQAWHNVWTRGRGAIGTIMLEEHIFKPIPEAVIEDQSRWPIFGLYDAVVRESGRATPTSLLAANATVSVTVIGRLAGTEEHADRRMTLSSTRPL